MNRTLAIARKKVFKRWMLRLCFTALLITGLLTAIVLNPALTYAHQTTHAQYTVFHHQRLQSLLKLRLDEATALLQQSDFYDPQLKLDVCLADGSPYPALIGTLKGRAFAHGFYDKIVLEGRADPAGNYVVLNGYRWNLTQLLAHEATHCYQFHKLGMRHSNPVAGYPEWKWEGYPEYVARREASQKDLSRNIVRLLAAEKTDHNGWILFEDGTGTVISYYKSWLLMQYCLDVKGMRYVDVLRDTTTEEAVRMQMMRWHGKQKEPS